jgi:ABC-2 type transport system permease protein
MEAAFRDCVEEERHGGRTILLSSHILSEVEALCERVTIIRAGRAVESGTLAEMRHLTRTSIAAEASQRAEPVLATATRRVSWGGGYLAIAAAGAAAVLAAAGIGAGLAFGLRTGDPGAQVPRLLGAALAQVPAVLAVASVAVLLFGLLPDACVTGGWLALGVAAALVLLGPSLRLAQPIQDISPFSHVPKLPGGTFSAAPLAWLAVAAVLLAAAGLTGLRRRDIG